MNATTQEPPIDQEGASEPREEVARTPTPDGMCHNCGLEGCYAIAWCCAPCEREWRKFQQRAAG